ncbi:Acyl-CoA N-acyltransferases (NAT) superfamily protein [Rhynchospora pubera]|uniref:Acyl-CoA N-acyltransferases (NAT) superfamily protein n=1 Tax=Rhynchospora pubera TaxID=906938 RepID=A0AAV8F5C9_9POAL|nr:Acyl-CoA N-acyltransferases (NAT) superfamily protein [Rhynchospora pubera]
MAIHSTLAISYASLSPIEPQSKPKPKPKTKLNPPPLSISTNRSSVDPVQVQHLFASCGHSCHRFPRTGPDGRVEPVELEKLRVALAHSFVVVSVLCKARFLEGEKEKGVLEYGFEDLFGDSDQRLVGFGRAVSDCGLTASIHDVVVIPSLRRRGIGQKIINRILRILTSRGIYDISALCTENERLFFKACGFGFDSLGSTTMMYTQSPGATTDNDGFTVTTSGRMQLLVPPPTHQLKLWKKD